MQRAGVMTDVTAHFAKSDANCTLVNIKGVGVSEGKSVWKFSQEQCLTTQVYYYRGCQRWRRET